VGHLNNLALLLLAMNRLGETELLFRRALAIAAASYGPDHPDVAIRLNNLASLLHDIYQPLRRGWAALSPPRVRGLCAISDAASAGREWIVQRAA
jgi:hypothetical protein